jgi:hypothetical protein
MFYNIFSIFFEKKVDFSLNNLENRGNSPLISEFCRKSTILLPSAKWLFLLFSAGLKKRRKSPRHLDEAKFQAGNNQNGSIYLIIGSIYKFAISESNKPATETTKNPTFGDGAIKNATRTSTDIHVAKILKKIHKQNKQELFFEKISINQNTQRE